MVKKPICSLVSKHFSYLSCTDLSLALRTRNGLFECELNSGNLLKAFLAHKMGAVQENKILKGEFVEGLIASVALHCEGIIFHWEVVLLPMWLVDLHSLILLELLLKEDG